MDGPPARVHRGAALHLVQGQAQDALSGRGVWEFSPGTVEGYVTGGVFSPPVLSDGVVYVGGVDGRLSAFME